MLKQWIYISEFESIYINPSSKLATVSETVTVKKQKACTLTPVVLFIKKYKPTFYLNTNINK